MTFESLCEVHIRLLVDDRTVESAQEAAPVKAALRLNTVAGNDHFVKSVGASSFLSSSTRGDANTSTVFMLM